MSNWRKYRFTSRLIHSLPGVYAIYHKGILVYIGQSRNVKTRLWHHKQVNMVAWGIKADDCAVKIRYGRKKGEWLMLEYRLLSRVSTRFNARFTKAVA